jgi:transposase
MKAYSLDLRERVIAAVDAGEISRRSVAHLFGISYVWIKKLLRQRHLRGDIAPLPHGGGQKPLLDEETLERLRQEVTGKSDATLKELQKKIRGANGRRVSTSTISRALKKLGLSRKKEGHFSRRTG